MEILENLINLKLHIGYAYHKKALLLVEEHKYKEALIACSKAIKYDLKMLDAYQAQVSVYEALTGNEILLYQAYVSFR